MNSSAQTDIVDRIMALGPFLDRAAAQRAVSALLQALSKLLSSDERERVARALPAPLAQIVREAATADAPTSLVQNVARRLHVPVGRAIELSQITLRALGEVLPVELRGRLERALPQLADWLEPPAAPVVEQERVPLANRHDLASGRPGSRRPLSSADSRVLQHIQSIARSDDPHADTKLSSARGLTQEREDESLASARPGPGRPLPS